MRCAASRVIHNALHLAAESLLGAHEVEQEVVERDMLPFVLKAPNLLRARHHRGGEAWRRACSHHDGRGAAGGPAVHARPPICPVIRPNEIRPLGAVQHTHQPLREVVS
eukprot:1087703-Prymnesium_polylepis.1